MPLGLHSVISDTKEYIADRAVAKARLVPKGTLLVSFKLTLGRLAYAGRDLFTNEAIAALLDINEGVITQRYLYWYLTYYDWDKATEGDHKIKGKTLNKAKLQRLPVLIPPLAEQKRIVAVLDEGFEAIERAEAALQRQPELCDDLIGAVRDNFFAELARAGASVRLLGEIMHFQNGRAFKKSEWVSSGLPIIRIQNLNDASKPFNYYAGDYDQRIEVNPGDLLFSWSGTVGSSFGPHIWQGERAVLNQHIFKVGIEDILDSEYAYYALLHITADIERQVTGAVGLVHVTQARLKQFPIPVPPLSDQHRLVEKLGAVQERIARLRETKLQHFAELRELRQSLLNSVFTEGNALAAPHRSEALA